MFDVRLAASLQDIQESAHITVDIGEGVLERIADPRLGGEIDNNAKRTCLKQTFYTRSILQSAPDKSKAGQTFKESKAILLQRDLVVVIQVVKSGNLVPLPQQTLYKVKTDKTGSAGNKYPAHPVFLSRLRVDPLLIQREAAEIIGGFEPARQYNFNIVKFPDYISAVGKVLRRNGAEIFVSLQ